MSTTLTSAPVGDDAKHQDPQPSVGGGGFPPPARPRGDNGGSGEPDPVAQTIFRYKLGTWVGIGGIVMIFAAFSSAMVVRSGISGDWVAVDLPQILWVSTALLLASSFTIEKAKRMLRIDSDEGVRHWLAVTLGLGVLFVVSQWMGWQALAERGIYIASNPGSSFFYLLTATHALHILGGVLALLYAVVRVWQPGAWVTRQAAVEATAIYWHFMDGLWIYLLLLLMLWR